MSKKWIIVALMSTGILAAGFSPLGSQATAAIGGAFRGGGFRQKLANSPIGKLLTGQIGRMLVLKSKLNITDEQREKIRTIVESHKTEIASVAKPLSEKRRALRDAVLAETPDEKAIRAAADKLGKAMGDAAVLASKVKGEVRPVLTDEQAKLIEDFAAESDGAVDAFLKQMGEQK